MKEAILIITIVISVLFIATELVIWSDRTNAEDDASLIQEFEYNETSYYMYLDDATDYEGNLIITLREGISRTYVTTMTMEPTGTSAEAIQFFKEKLSKYTIVKQWKENQNKTPQQLKK